MGDIVAYYPPETRAMPLTLIRRERMLPVPGKVLVSAGEKVQPTQVVAQAEISGEVRIVNVARLLRLPASRAVRFIKVKEGDDVTTHTVIAARGWLPSGRVTSPTDGFVYRVDKAHGRILIKVVTKPFQLTAYLGGVVTNVMSGRGVVIETTGTLLQATVGFGDEASCMLSLTIRPMSCAPNRSMSRRTARSSSVAPGSMRPHSSRQRNCKSVGSLPAVWMAA